MKLTETTFNNPAFSEEGEDLCQVLSDTNNRILTANEKKGYWECLKKYYL